MGLRRNKKGVGFEMLVIILAVIIGGTVVIGVTTQFVSKMDEPRAKAICAASVATRANAVMRVGSGAAEIHLTPLMCTTFDKEINAKGKENEEVIAEFLEYAVDAWKMFGEGKYVKLDNIYMGLSGRDICFRAYNIKIDGLKKTIPSTEIDTYAIHHNMTNMNLSYQEYFETRPYCHFAVVGDIENKHVYSVVFASVWLKTRGVFVPLIQDPPGYAHNMIYIVELGKPIITKETRIIGGLFKWSESPCVFISGVMGS